jgi:hypothetical protein
MKSWWRAVLTYPPTWAAGGLLVVAAGLLVATVEPSGGMFVLFVALVLILALAWPLILLLTGRLARLQYPVTPQVTEIDPALLAALAKELGELDDPQPGKRTTLMKVLERRLDAGELTYARYMGTADGVYRAALDNLHEVAVAHDSISSIDEGYVARRLAELDADAAAGGTDPSSVRERETLAQRLELRSIQQHKVSRLMAQNEAALTALDRTTTALADVPIGKQPEDADAAMAALEELAARTGMYAT